MQRKIDRQFAFQKSMRAISKYLHWNTVRADFHKETMVVMSVAYPWTD